MADSENNVTMDNDGKELKIIEVDSKEEKEGSWVDVNDYISQLPPEVRRRILALKKLQLDVTKLETSFYAEMHALEEKYAPLYKPIFEKRRQITTGEYEPNDNECDFPISEEDAVSVKVNQLKLETDNESGDAGINVVGIPYFWLRIFRNVELLEELTEDADYDVLQHLIDIKVELSSEPMGFKLLFYFSPNEYFKNSVLTKTYEMKCDYDADDPFSFEGPEIIKCTGCNIDWNAGKNVTKKIIKKKQKHKQRGSVRTVSKTIDAPSFFNFFTPPTFNIDGEMDEEVQLRLTNDFEVGQYIRERIVPRAVLFFTGEALDDEEEEEDWNEEDEEDDGEDEEEGDKEEMKVSVPNRSRKVPQDGGKNAQPDCKQQ